MSRTRVTKTSFTAGELDPRLLGRLDLRAVEDGAMRLRNVLVQPTGGVTRRPGTNHVAILPDARRLVAFDGFGGGEILAFAPFRIDVVHAVTGQVLASVDAPWNVEQLPGLAWARLADGLLLCHHEVEPQRLTRLSATSWRIAAWAWEDSDDGSAFPALHQPYVRFARPEISLQAVRQDQAQAWPEPIPAGATVQLKASAAVFTALHQGTRFRIHGREILVTNPSPTAPNEAVGQVLQELPNGRTTRDWDEQAFSEAHGFPRSLTFHQNRLVIGGSRDLPDHLWLSRTGRPFDFDPGTGLDDEAIAFRLAADRLQGIVNVCGGRRLEVLTTAGEWVVNGQPLTPTTAQVTQQTSVGSYAARRLPCPDVDGATLFVGASGRDLREFLYTDTEQAYQAADIALLARHLMRDPVDLAFDQARRLLIIVRQDGAAAAVTIDRNSNVVPWTLLNTDGRFRAAVTLGHDIFLLVEREAGITLERWDEAATMDDAVCLPPSADPRRNWAMPGHLYGAHIGVVADGVPVTPRSVGTGSLDLQDAASEVWVGRTFEHEIAALPLSSIGGSMTALDVCYRPVRISLRLLDTGALSIDTGGGLRDLALPGRPAAFTGDITTRTLGWRRDPLAPVWRVSQDTPLPCTVLAVTTEIKVND
jgi:hypothetical protein